MRHDRPQEIAFLHPLSVRLAGIVLLVVLGGSSPQALGESANCKRAEAIVEEARTIYQSNKPSYKLILEKLKIAQDLCPTSGNTWKYAYCSALALGDQTAARRYKQRAIDNDIISLDCEAERAPVVEQRAPLSPTVREKYALIVGIGTFQDETIPHLRFAAKDARDFAMALQDPLHGHFRPENVTLLTDKSATREAILNALQSLFTKAHEDDLVVIYVSSHGSARQQDQGLGGSGYIVTYDSAQKKIWNNAIEYQNFAQQTSLIKARRKVTFLDTCYSGQASAGSKALEIEENGVDDRTAKMFLSSEGSFVITSSNSTEQSWESEAMHNSYFTHYLIEGLNRSKQPPTLKQVFGYLSAKVAEAVSREYNKPQHPQIQPVDGPDDITIGVVPGGTGSEQPAAPPQPAGHSARARQVEAALRAALRSTVDRFEAYAKGIEIVREGASQQAMVRREDAFRVLDTVKKDVAETLPQGELAPFRDAVAELIQESKNVIDNGTPQTNSAVVTVGSPFALVQNETVKETVFRSVVHRVLGFLRNASETSPIDTLCVLTTPANGADIVLYPPSVPSDRRGLRTASRVTLYLGRYAVEINQQRRGYVNLLLDPQRVVECALPGAIDTQACRPISGAIDRCP